MQNYSVQQFIKHFDLQPHPEGGYYKETYRSDEMIPVNTLPSGFKGDRNMATAIYFLLEKGNFSAFHRIKSDECWHFYAGQTLEVYMIMPDGNLKIIKSQQVKFFSMWYLPIPGLLQLLQTVHHSVLLGVLWFRDSISEILNWYTLHN